MADRHPTATFEGETRSPALEARDPFAAGQFPVCVATHDTGQRFLFDLSTLLLLLNCRPGDRVLDLGAGSGFSSEMLARFGYHVIAVDPDHTALGHNRRRPGYDRGRIEGTVQVVQGIAERLPFETASFDGVLGMNVVHHVPDLAAAVSELARVLKPGCRGVFSEPGLEHLDQRATQRAMRELGENDRAFDVITFLELARARGFPHAMLSATLHPVLRLLPLEEIATFVTGQHPRRPMTPEGVIEELHRRHPFAVLIREGVRPKTSRYPSVLGGTVMLEGLPARATAGETLVATAHLDNTGDSLWLSAHSRFGGYVNLGCKLLAADGRLISDRLDRTALPHDVAPGERMTVRCPIALPRDLSTGAYRLHIDLVSELVCWFSDLPTGTPFIHDIHIDGRG